MNNKLRPAMIGGLVMGILSGLPYIGLGNLACCLWVVTGGALATYLYIKRSPAPVEMGEGAVLGLLAGIVGSIVKIIVGVPLAIMLNYPLEHTLINLMERLDPQKGELYRQGLEYMISRPVSEQFAATVFSVRTLLGFLVTLVFALAGGLLAVPLFEKRKTDPGPMAPPPPPYYGGGPPGGTYPPPPPPPPGGYGDGGPSAQ